MRVFFAFGIALNLLISNAAAQETNQISHDKDQENARENEKNPSRSARLGRLPIEWLIGPYIPVKETLHPLTCLRLTDPHVPKPDYFRIADLHVSLLSREKKILLTRA